MAAFMEVMLNAVCGHDDSWPFHKPVDPSEAVDYYDLIKDPVDLSLVRTRLKAGGYYATLEMFVEDLRRMCRNCQFYNSQTTAYYACATKIMAYIDQYLHEHVVEEDV
jgi:histone acetyltransferase